MPPQRYVAYFDESGDHGLGVIDSAFPVFVLCAAVFAIEDYLARDSPSLAATKFRLWGHDNIVFHSHSIRNRLGPFSALKDAGFASELNAAIADYFRRSTATIVAAVIDKRSHRDRYRYPDNPYHLSLRFCLERLHSHVRPWLPAGEEITCVFEKRGLAEDRELMGVFRDVCAGANYRNAKLPFRAVFADKLANIAGLQVADLAAYPIARHIINPGRDRPDWLAVRPRIRADGRGRIDGYGLKVFP